MKTFRRFLASLMVAVMVLTAAPLSGFVGMELNLDWLSFDWLDFTPKASAATYSGTCGDNLTWSLDTGTGELIISGEGAMTDYSYSSKAPWYNYRSSIKKVTISDSVTRIGDYAFEGCTGLTSITIPDSVTDIGSNAFSYCTSLTNITIPDSVTRIGEYAFEYCQLESVTLGKGVKSLSTLIGDYFCGAGHIENFYYTGSLTDWCAMDFDYYFDGDMLSFPLYNVSNFYIEGNLVGGHLDIPDSVTSVSDGAFVCCYRLTSVTIPDSVTSIGSYAFYGCTGLTSVTIPDSVTNIGYATFEGCTGLTSVTIPDSVTSIDDVAFEGCESLTSVTIPDSVRSIGDVAFYGCTGLTELTMPISAKIGNYESPFYGCTNIEKITLTKGDGTVQDYGTSTSSSSVTTYYQYTPWYISGCPEIVIEEGVTAIGSYTFYNCTNLDFVHYLGDSSQLTVDSSALYGTSAEIHDCIAVSTSPLVCTQEGTGSWYCEECDEDIVSDVEVSALGHDFGDWKETTAPTCTETGVDTKYCSRCDVTETRVSDALGHDFGDWQVTTAPTCTETGVDTKYCSRCDVTETRVSDALGHDFGDWQVTTAPTCTETGVDTKYCSRCDVTETRVSDALGHDFGDWQVTTAPTCTETGVDTKYCSRCDVTETRVADALGHDWSNKDGICARENCGYGCEHPEESITWETVIEPTCVPGLERGLCNICGIGEDKAIVCDKSTYPESPHNYTNNCSKNWSFSYEGANKLILKFSSSTQTENNYDYIYIYNSAGTQIGKYCGTQLSGAEIEVEGSSFQIKLTSDGSNTNYGFKFDSITAIIESVGIEREIPAIADHDWSNNDGICANGCGTGCSHPAFTNGECDVCGSTCAVLGHDFGEWQETTAPTCTETGIDTKYCSRCEETETRVVVALGHDLAENSNICSVCGKNGGTCGTSLIWTLEENGTLIISGTGAMTDYSDAASVPWYTLRPFITSVVIGDGVTSIGNYAFYSCGAISELTMPISAKIYNSSYTFGGCNSIEKITLTKGNGTAQNYGTSTSSSSTVTYYKYTPWYISGCSEIVIEDGVTGIGSYTFYICKGLTSVTIPDSVISIGNDVFNNCSALENVYYTGDVADWCAISFNSSTSNPMCYADTLYIDGELVTELVIPDSVTSIKNYAFYGCTGLASVTIPDSVTSIGDYVFYGCTGLTSITIPDSVTSIGPDAFYGCTGLTSITIPDSVTRIGDYSFYGCTGLTSVTIPDSVTRIGDYSFYGCTGLTSVTIPDSVTSIGSYAFYGCTGLTSVTIPDGVTSIGSYAFYGCTGLTSVTIPDGVTSIGDYTFYGCTGLTELTMPISAKIYNSSYTFYNCTNIEKITLTKGNGTVQNYGTSTSSSSSSTNYQYTPWYISGCSEIIIEDGVTSIGNYTFYNCSGITKLTVPISAKIYNSRYTFGGCTNIEKIILTKGDGTVQNYGTDSYYSATSTYYYYTPWNISTSLKELVIEDGVTGIGSYTFYGCSELTSLTIGDSVTSIGSYAFYNCKGITSITIPGSITSIGSDAFYNCSALENVYYTNDIVGWCAIVFDSAGANPMCYADNLYFDGELVTEIVIPNEVRGIGSYAFYGCTGITSVTIGSGLTMLNVSAFVNCTSISSITVSENNEYFANDEFGVLYNKSKTKVILYPGGNERTSYTLPLSVVEIGNYAFDHCPNLMRLDYPGTEQQWSSVVVGTNNAAVNDIIVIQSNGENPTYASGSCGEDLEWILYADGTLVISGTGAMTDWTSTSSVPWYSRNRLIKSIVIGAGVTSISSYAFYGCAGLMSIAVDESNTAYSLDEYGVLFNKDKTVLIKYPAGNTRTSYTIPDSVTSIGNYAFYNCSGLTELTMPISAKIYNSSYTFGGCTNIEKITLTKGNGTVQSYGTSTSSSATNTYYQYTPWYISGCSEIVIEDGITHIGYYAFYNCTGLTNVIIGNSVTSIGSYALDGCTGLVNIVVDEDNTQYSSDEFGVLYNKNKTQLIQYPAGNTRTSYTIPDSVTSIGYDAFYNCSGLTELTMPISAKIYNSSYTFYNCTNIEKITLTKGNGTAQIYSSSTGESNTYYQYTPWYISGCSEIVIEDGVTSIGDYIFYNCSGIKELTIPASTKIYNSSYTFGGCTNIEKITLTKGNGTVWSYSGYSGDSNTYYRYTPWYISGCSEIVIEDGVTSVGSYAFYNCTGLTSVIIPDSVTSIGSYAFYDCDSLKSIIIGDSVTSIGYDAFYSCNSLASVTIGNSVTSIGSSTFEYCSALENVYYTGDVAGWCAIIFNSSTSNPMYYADNLYIDGELVTELVIPDSVTSLNSYSFYNCSGIKSVTIGSGLISWNTSTFTGCTSLSSVIVSENNEYFLSDESGVVYNKDKTTLIFYPRGSKRTYYTISDSVTNIGSYAFYSCDSLTSVTIPDSVTNIGSYAFYGCDSLTSVTIPDRVTNIGSYAFYSCDSLTSETIGDSVTSIGDYAFYSCDSLTSVIIPDSVTNIGSYAFYSCDSLTSVTIGDSVTRIGYSAFEYCSALENIYYTGDVAGWCAIIFNSSTSNPMYYADNLYIDGELVTELVIPDSVTSIGSYAFCNCTGLTIVTIPDSVTSIGYYAFGGCIYLAELTMPISAKIYNSSNTFYNCTNIEKITLTKGNGTVQNYGTSTSSNSSSTNYQYTPWYISGCPEIVIAEGVTAIGAYTFYNCTNLVSVHYLGNSGQLTIGSNALYGTSVAIHYCTKTVTSNATCTLDGAYDWYCQTCKKNIAENIVVPALGHNLGEWQVTTAPTCTETGVETKFCSRCDVTETRVVEALGHDLGEWQVVTDSTCTETGIGIGGCSRCNVTESVVIEAKGHDWSNKDGICARDNCGYACEHPEEAVTWETLVEPTCVPGLEHGSCDICGMKGEKTIICDSSTYPESPHDYYNSCNETWTFSYPGADKLILKFSNSTETESNCDSIYIYNRAGVLIGQYSGTQLSGKEIEIEGSSFQIRLTSDSSVTRYGFKFDYIKAVISVGALEAIISAVSDHDWSNKDGICANGCGTECAHETFTDGECDVCGATCLTIGHIYDDIAGECVICGHNCENMGHIFNSDNTECVVCGLVTGTCGDSLTWTLDRNGKLVITGTGAMVESFNSTSLYTWHAAGVIDRIETIVIEDGVTSIGDYAFYCFESLTEITIPDSVTAIGEWAFAECLSLTEITIPDSVTSIGDYAFIECLGLTNVTIGAGVESIGDMAFVYCNSLGDVIFLGEDEISLGKHLFITEIDDEIEDLGEIPGLMICCKENSWMHFYVDSNDKKYCLLDSEGNPAFEIQGDSLASYRGNASNVILPSVSKIGYGAFANNSTIETVEIQKGVSRIYNNAFKNCTGLKSVYIPQSVTSIGAAAFNGCDDVTIWCYAGSYADEYAQTYDINVEYITLSIDDSIIYIAPNEQATVTYSLNTHIEDNVSVVWESTDKTVVTVDSFGNIKGIKAGTAVVVLTSKDGSMRDYCLVKVVGIEALSTLNTDFESGIISGLSSNTTSLDGLIRMTDSSCNLSYTTLGTDSIVYVERDNEIVDAYTILVYGDVNGDGWYDGMDAVLVSCLANGMLTKEDVSEAVYMAADCNHDGVIDQLDVDLLNEAGTLLANVDQSKPAEVLLETSSAYVEYLDLIDQSPEIETEEETEDIPDADAEGNPETDVESEDTTPEQDTNVHVFEMIMNFIKSIFEMLFAYIPVPLK